ncbi:hypothetical protein [uncultured Wocania sp.]
MSKDIRSMNLVERYKYINEQKRKRFNPTTEEKEAQNKKNNEQR